MRARTPVYQTEKVVITGSDCFKSTKATCFETVLSETVLFHKPIVTNNQPHDF